MFEESDIIRVKIARLRGAGHVVRMGSEDPPSTKTTADGTTPSKKRKTKPAMG